MSEGNSQGVEELLKDLQKQRESLAELVATLEEQRAAWKEEREALLEQATSFSFEIAKHLTTLNTAAILVFLAAGEEVSLPLWVALLFVGSLAGAALSMVVTGFRWVRPNWASLGSFGMAAAISCFFVGLLYSVLHALFLL